MATRRPRVKPTAILKARRPQIAATQQTNTATIKFEDEPKLTDAGQRSGDNAAESLKNHIDTSTHTDNTNGNASNATESTATIATTSNTVNHTTNQSNTTDKLKEPGPNGPPLVINEPPLPPQSSPPLSTSTPVEAKPFRRLLTPAVNIPNRRRPTNANLTKLHLDIARPSQTASSPARSQEFAAIRSPSPTRADEKPAPGVKAEGQVSAASTASTTATFVKEFSVPSPSPLKDDLPQRRGTVDNEECFKSPPFMSPSMQYNRRQDPSSSPFTDCYGDDVKSPSSVSSNKIRPRIRPTPYFMVRRNSIQGQSEMDEESTRRQRHYSTSSTQGGYTPTHSSFQQRSNHMPNRNNSRIRTESVSSNISDVFSTRDYGAKQKRSMRSEEFQRVANAKREFNQRLNGNPPDKTRLTMYDMIYYNPTSNPMKKPAVKSEKRDGDSVSVTSVKTIDSRSSVKTESSVKSESTDSEANMPVPQLKLGPNGEIVLDEKSLVIETTGDKEARALLANSDVIYDDEFSGSSGFYKRHKRTKDWPPEETIKFYRALQTIGTDFSVMLELFPYRTRRDLKLKFKKEERQNMALINKALLHPKQFNIEMLKEQFEEEDRETKAKNEEYKEAKQKLIAEKKKQLTAAKKRQRRPISTTARQLLDGEVVYENEFVALPKMRRTRRKKAETENELESPVKTPTYQSLNKTPLRPSQTDSPLNSPMAISVIRSPRLPSFSEVMSSKNKSYLQQQNNNNIDRAIETKHHVYAKHPLGYSIADDEPPPVTYSIPTPVMQQVHDIDDAMSTITVEADATEAVVFENHNVTNGYGEKHAVKVDTNDIMNMDIIFDDAPIVEDTSIVASVVDINAVDGLTAVNDNTIYIIGDTPVDGSSYMAVENVNGIDATAGSVKAEPAATVDENVPQRISVINMDEMICRGKEIQIKDLSTFCPVKRPERVTGKIRVNSFAIEKPNDETVVRLEEVHKENSVVNLDPKTEAKPQSEIINEDPKTKSDSPCTNESNIIEEKSDSPSKTEIKVVEEKSQAAPKILPRLGKRKPPPVLVGRNVRRKETPAIPKTATVVKQEETPPTASIAVQIVPTPSVASTPEIVIEQPAAPLAEAANELQPDSEFSVKSEQTDLENIASTSSSTTSAINVTAKQEQPAETVAPDADDDSSQSSPQNNNPMDSLVIVESRDPANPDRIIHEVHVRCPLTNEISEQPLDLPDEVIQRIRSSMQ